MAKLAFLGLDIGGTGAKAGVFDSAGRMLGFGRQAFAPTCSAKGHVEIPIEDIYSAARNAARTAICESGTQVLALSVSSQGQTFVPLDADDQPLHPAILWYDGRAEEQAKMLQATIETRRQDLHPPLVEAISSAAKIIWLRERYPEKMAKACRYLLLPEYISLRLTGVAVTDRNTATSTGLYANGSADYSTTALEAAGIDKAQLARIQQAATPIASVLTGPAAEWGLSGETLMVTGTNDQYAGALGAGNCRPGIISETSGTCLALVTLAKKLPETMPPGLIGDRFPIQEYSLALAYARTAGLVLDWFRRVFCPSLTLSQLDEMASGVPIGSDGLAVLPHFEGMVSPNPAPEARGLIANLSLNHGLAHIYRAILESLAFSLRENAELLVENGFRFDVIRSIGGGAKSNFWLQMKADVTGMPIEKPAVTEAATLGAAMLSAVGAGEYSSIIECCEEWYATERIFEPDTKRHLNYEEPYQRYVRLWQKTYCNKSTSTSICELGLG